MWVMTDRSHSDVAKGLGTGVLCGDHYLGAFALQGSSSAAAAAAGLLPPGGVLVRAYQEHRRTVLQHCCNSIAIAMVKLGAWGCAGM